MTGGETERLGEAEDGEETQGEAEEAGTDKEPAEGRAAVAETGETAASGPDREALPGETEGRVSDTPEEEAEAEAEEEGGTGAVDGQLRVSAA